MELYTRTIPDVTIDLPTVDTTVGQVDFVLNNADAVALTGTATNGVGSVTLPYLPSDGVARLDWNVTIPGSGNQTITQVLDVVTPILTIAEVRKIIDEDSNTVTPEEDVRAIEAATRHIINAHTGQNFGKFIGTKNVKGSDGTNLKLPARLLKFNKINGVLPGNNYRLENEGWSIRGFPWGVPTVRADYQGYHMTNTGVIRNPNSVKMTTFNRLISYEIDGEWGWEAVPPQVKEAAKLLIADYSCSSVEYRDRYLSSMTSADWRIQFNDGAFEDTGNVRANQLLSQYVLRRGWMVL